MIGRAFISFLPDVLAALSFDHGPAASRHSARANQTKQISRVQSGGQTADRKGTGQEASRAKSPTRSRSKPGNRAERFDRRLRQAADRQEPATARSREHGYVGATSRRFLSLRERRLDKEKTGAAGVLKVG